MAKLYGVSVGPGSADLMTVRSVRIIEKCDVIAVPRTKGENTMAYSIACEECDMQDKEIVYAEFLMSMDKEVLRNNYENIAKNLEKHLDNEKSIAFLNIGDISIYSTFSYIADIIISDGYDVEICPGVPSFCAVAAELKKPIAQGKENIVIIPGDSREFDELAEIKANKIVMKSSRAIEDIKSKFSGKDVSGVENCGLESQKIYNSADELNDNTGYFTTVLIKG